MLRVISNFKYRVVSCKKYLKLCLPIWAWVSLRILLDTERLIEKTSIFYAWKKILLLYIIFYFTIFYAFFYYVLFYWKNIVKMPIFEIPLNLLFFFNRITNNIFFIKVKFLHIISDSLNGFFLLLLLISLSFFF